MWKAFLGTVVAPLRTFSDLERDPHAARHGGLVLLGVCAIYTAILVAFIARGYPAAASSVLGLPVDRQYTAQVWYQAPLFFSATALTAAGLVLVARLGRHRLTYPVAFGRVALATAVPFALTTMLVESTVAVLLVVGVLEPLPTLHWLTGAGAWFAALYQSIGLVWLAALVAVAARASGVASWWMSALAAVPLLVLYGLPVALFIR